MGRRPFHSRRSLPFLILAGVGVVALAVGWLAFGDEARSLASLRRIDDHPLYVMHVYGAHDFEAPWLEGVPPGSGGATEPAWACTCFAALAGTEGSLIGRNFDWFNRPSLLLFAHPRDGYDSVSMVDVAYLGVGAGDLGWEDRIRLLDAPRLPFDGMNEAGLAVGMMAVPRADTGRDPNRLTLDSLEIIRLILDQAATVDEAVALFGAYNISWGSGPPLHYLVADAGGHAAVVEFVEGEMVVRRNQAAWQASTNFVLAGKDLGQARVLCPRYARVSHVLEETMGDLSPGAAMELLAEVSQNTTMWSVVYDLSHGEISVAVGRDYGQVHHLRLRMQR